MKLLLHSIYNRGTKDKILPQYSNRVCTLDFVKESNGLEYMLIDFEKGGKLKHFENIVDVCEDDYGVWVTTISKSWRFDNISDDEDTESDDTTLRVVSVCTRCGKRAIYRNNYNVEVTIDNEEQDGKYMLCICDNCDTKYIVEVK